MIQSINQKILFVFYLKNKLMKLLAYSSDFNLIKNILGNIKYYLRSKYIFMRIK